MDTLRQDLRYALRTLLRFPGFTLATMLTLGIGIGATTTVFSLANALLFRPLPVPEAERVVSLSEVRQNGPAGSTFSYPDYEAIREAGGVFTDLAAEGVHTFGLSTGETPEAVGGAFVSGNYFRMLGIAPALGRFLLPEEDQVGGASAVVVLGYELWRRRFGADPAVLGRTLRLNGHPVTVVGVAPAGFAGTFAGVAPALWIPIAARAVLAPGMVDRPGVRTSWLQLSGRLRPGVTPAQAEASLSRVVRELAAAQARPRPVVGVTLTRAGTVPPMMRGMAAGILALLLAAAGLVLLIASTNVAGMLLARSSTRRREIAIRRAIGARTPRIVRQLLTESMVLGLLGGVLGILLSVSLSSLILSWRLPLPMPGERIALDLSPDLRVLGFALAMSLLSGVLFGLAPALQAVRSELLSALRDVGRGFGARSRLRDFFVVLQIAVSLLLLLSAGLLLRALQRAVQVDPGFRAAGVAVARLGIDPYGYDEAGGREFYRQLLERVRVEPGVEAASLAAVLPLTGQELVWRVIPPGQTEPESVRSNAVSAGYFATLGIPLVRGRAIEDGDRADSPPVAVVTEAFARRYFPGREVVGQRVEIRGIATEVVGVAADIRHGSLQEEPTPLVFLPLEQDFSAQAFLQVRTAGSEAAMVPAMRRVVESLNPAVVLAEAQPLSTAIAFAVLPQRLGAAAAGAFGLVGLLLAAIGLYGVIAFAVAQRTREIGIRTALGARAADIVQLVLRHALVLVAAGIAIGMAAGVGATRLLAGFLFGVSPTDPVAVAGVVTLLLGVALLASFLPARRATRVDPVIALRSE